jgi:hypothetical protein
MIDLHVSSPLNPLWHMISEYAFTPHGWLLPGSLALLAVGSALLALAVVRAGGDRRAALLVGVWAGCLLLIGAFPTDRPGVPLSMSGGIHRYAAFVAFLSLPLAGLLVARGGSYVRTARNLSVAALTSLFLVVVPYAARMLGLDPADVPAGLTQRLVVVFEIALLVALGLSALAAAGRVGERVGLDLVGVPDLDGAGLGIDQQDAHGRPAVAGGVRDVDRDLLVAGPVDHLRQVRAA